MAGNEKWRLMMDSERLAERIVIWAYMMHQEHVDENVKLRFYFQKP